MFLVLGLIFLMICFSSSVSVFAYGYTQKWFSSVEQLQKDANCYSINDKTQLRSIINGSKRCPGSTPPRNVPATEQTPTFNFGNVIITDPPYRLNDGTILLYIQSSNISDGLYDIYYNFINDFNTATKINSASLSKTNFTSSINISGIPDRFQFEPPNSLYIFVKNTTTGKVYTNSLSSSIFGTEW